MTRRVRPHVRELLADTLTPLEVYRRLASRSPGRFLFESVTGGEQVSRFSLLGCAPRARLRLWTDRLEISSHGEPYRVLPGAPLAALARVLGERVADPDGPALPVPLVGGWIGWFGYDLVRLVERLGVRPPDPFDLPVAELARFDTVVVFDHARQLVFVVSNEIEEEIDAETAEGELRTLVDLLTGPGGTGGIELPTHRPPAPTPSCSIDGPTFRQAVRRAKEAIREGEIFQVVLARRFSVPTDASPLALYRSLRLVNPSPYMVLLESPDLALVGSSPEMLVRKSGGRVATRPIAGTRPRGRDATTDLRLAEELLADPKERAEHVMLVDLGRNDLGRVAAPGCVRVPSFMEVERYSHVMHLVSSVEADLAPGRTGLDALLACFPAGTVSGAPKVRAMELIDELEPEARGPYAGAVGYLSDSGDLDTCIAIRTLVVRRGVTSVTAGAGIVADSDPAREEAETENKAAGLLAAVALANELDGPAGGAGRAEEGGAP